MRRSDADDADLRLAHRLDEESFTEHYGQVAQDFDAFRKRFTEHGEGWSSLWLAELDGAPVGLLVGTQQFEEDEDAGYVRSIGVIPAGRGRGVAKALLRHYFSAAQAEGRGAVLLHVDVANVTNALGRLRVGGHALVPRDRRLGEVLAGHDSRLTIGSRERDVRPTMAAVSSGRPTTRPRTNSHGMSRKWSAIGTPAASTLPTAHDAPVSG